MRRVEPGEWVALALVAEALIADVLLIRKGHEPISTCVRASRAHRMVTLALTCHLCLTVPFDPLTYAGRRFTRLPCPPTTEAAWGS